MVAEWGVWFSKRNPGHMAEFYRGLADFLRALLMIKLGGIDSAEVHEDLREQYAGRAERWRPWRAYAAMVLWQP